MQNNSIRKLVIDCIGILLTTSFISYAATETSIQKQITPVITLHIMQGDITQLNNVDIIVNAANKSLLRGGGVCGAIFAAAECKSLILSNYLRIHYPNGINPGQAVISPSCALRAQGIKHIIHAVGPIYKDYSDKTEAARILKSAYQESLSLASEHKDVHSIAFPFISSAIYGYPQTEAAYIALKVIIEFAQNNRSTEITDIYCVLFSQYDYDLFVKTLNTLKK